MGFCGKSDKAKIETIKKSAEEKVKIAVLGSYGEDSFINLEDLNINLRQIEGLTDIVYAENSIFEVNKIDNLPIEVVVDGYTFKIEETGNVTVKMAKPKVTHTINPDTQVEEGNTITITINATITEGTIVKITDPKGKEISNVETITYGVTENGIYTFIVEGSNGEKTLYSVEITNGTGEIFSDIYSATEIYKDRNEKIAKIPKGFAVGRSNTINTIDNGLVITDKIDETHKSIGNEFVWVPVEDPKDFKQVEGYSGSGRQSGEVLGEPSRYTWAEYFYATEIEEYERMYSSTISNKGFYCRSI